MLTEKKRKLIQTIDDSFHKLNGKPLPCPPDVDDRLRWLDEEAPYSILAHNADKDPHFVYANKYALTCFKYTEEEMLALPSRLSAGEQDRAERQRLLEKVTSDGIAYNYEGPRVDKNDKTFNIYDGIVWQLKDDNGTIWGQGALFWTDKKERPDWYSSNINEK